LPKKPYVKKLREEISRKLDIKTSYIYEKAKSLSTKTQTRTEDGIYLLAAQSGINLNKYLPREKVSEIRELLFRIKQDEPLSRSLKSTSKKIIPKIISTTVGKEFKISDPLLTQSILEESKNMSEQVYPLLYVFENSVRMMISYVMQKKYGSNWWDINISTDIRNEVKRRIDKENQNPWHGKRGAHPIFYTDLDHLSRIVQNNWPIFKCILTSQPWFTQRIDEISQSRNPVAHMNPLKKDDIQRIKVYFKDWEKLINAKRSYFS